MVDIVFRRNHRFIIDEAKLKPEARNPVVINSLYMSIYKEFMGACKNKVYCDLTTLDRMKALNAFAHNWLKERGYE